MVRCGPRLIRGFALHLLGAEPVAGVLQCCCQFNRGAERSYIVMRLREELTRGGKVCSRFRESRHRGQCPGALPQKCALG